MKSIMKSALRTMILLSVPLVYLSSCPALGQTLPSFIADGSNGNVGLDVNESPSIAGSSNTARPYLYAIYSDPDNSECENCLTLAVALESVSFTRYTTNLTINTSVNGGPAITTDDYGDAHFAFVDTAGKIEVWGWDPSLGFTHEASYQPYGENPYSQYYYPGVVAFQPAILCVPGSGSTTQEGCSEYIAWAGPAFDPYDGEVDGVYTNTAYANNDFPSQSFSQLSTAEGEYQASAGPSLAYYSGQVFLTFLDSSQGTIEGYTAGDPWLFTTTSPSQTWTKQTASLGYYKNNPAIMGWQGTLYAGYNSAYQEDNLWMTANAYQGAGWSPGPTNMGETMDGWASPSFAVVDTPSSTVFFFGASYGRQLYLYSDTITFGGGGGHSGGGGGGCPTVVSSGKTASPDVICSQ